MNYKSINNDIIFNFYNLNVYDNIDNIINNIKLDLFNYDYKPNIIFKFCCLLLIN